MTNTSVQVTTEALKIVTSGFFGALAAYLFNLLHWKTTERIRKTESILNSIKNNLDNIEKSTITYWLTHTPTTDKEITDIKHLEITIKSLHRTQNNLINQLSRNNTPSKNGNQLKEKIKTLNEQLYDITTGEDFESRQRKPRPAKCNTIARKCAEIKSVLNDINI